MSNDSPKTVRTPSRAALAAALADAETARRNLQDSRAAASKAQDHLFASQDKLARLRDESATADPEAFIGQLAGRANFGVAELTRPAAEARAKIEAAQQEVDAWRRARDVAEQAIPTRERAVDFAERRADEAARAVLGSAIDITRLLAEAEEAAAAIVGKRATKLMADSDVLKEFVVALGWKNDEAGQRRFFESLEVTTKSALKLGAALVGAAVGAFVAVQRIASGFERLSYQSERVKASGSNIRAFEYAFSQLGGTIAQADSVLESVAEKLRTLGPGQEGFFRQWGVDVHNTNGQLKDTTQLLAELFKSQKFLSQPEYPNSRSGGCRLSKLSALVAQRRALHERKSRTPSPVPAKGH